MDGNQFLKNIQLEQYDQLSVSNFESILIASFGPLAKNYDNEVYFNLSEPYEVDTFHPVNSNPDQIEKYIELAYSSGHVKNIINMIEASMINIPNITLNHREIIINKKSNLFFLGKMGIKGKRIDNSKIKLYLPLTIKQCHIEKIAAILKDYVHN
jgi:hypothetical protein